MTFVPHEGWLQIKPFPRPTDNFFAKLVAIADGQSGFNGTSLYYITTQLNENVTNREKTVQKRSTRESQISQNFAHGSSSNWSWHIRDGKIVFVQYECGKGRYKYCP